MLENGQILAARFALLRRLGAGRWGEVWLAREHDRDRDVALKVLAPELAAQPKLRARFLEAARLQAELRNPAVLPCEEVIDSEPCFSVLAYAPGGSLGAWRGRPWLEVVPVLDRVAQGVAALHAHGYVHRDLKPANALLDEQGQARLSDFGVAARIGEDDSAPPGSPFSASPQQLAGQAPSVADDVYGLGALAYELLSGYPPHYPDAAAAAAGVELPATIQARVPVSATLTRLVLDCLSGSPLERPAGMTEVREALARLPREHAAREGATVEPRAALRAPADAPAPIEPRWRRTDVTGDDAADRDRHALRRRGIVWTALAVLVVAAILVIFALPRWVQPPPVATTPVVEDPAAAQATRAAEQAARQRDLKRLAELKREYEQLLPSVRERLDALVARAAGEWGGEPFARARQTFDSAAQKFTARDYEPALEELKRVAADLTTTEKASEGALRAALEAGRAALESGAAADAERQFALALKLKPGHAQATRGLERAKTLDEVRRILAEAARLEGEGRSDDAAALYRKALALDRDATPAQQGLARIQSAQSGSAFAAAMSQGLGALAAGNLDEAGAAFERAGRIRPGAPEVQDGLAQVARARGDAGITTHLGTAERAEREERWQTALEAYRQALAIDPNLLAAQEGAERAEPRAAIEAQLNGYAARPERLFSTEVRAAARAALHQARSINPPGPVLRSQIDKVTALVESAEVPVAIALTSDNQTDVTIYRIGRIGMFDRKDMDLLPGRYTIVGTRSGFRDVRREVTVLPGQKPPPVAIRCEDPI
jgi:eukaryotic-like serine/threonine-protein kinase